MISPENLLRALLQEFYSIRSERQLIEQLNYNLLFRWFVGLSMDAPVWDAMVFMENCDHLLVGDVAHKFLAASRTAVGRALPGWRHGNRRPDVDEALPAQGGRRGRAAAGVQCRTRSARATPTPRPPTRRLAQSACHPATLTRRLPIWWMARRRSRRCAYAI